MLNKIAGLGIVLFGGVLASSACSSSPSDNSTMAEAGTGGRAAGGASAGGRAGAITGGSTGSAGEQDAEPSGAAGSAGSDAGGQPGATGGSSDAGAAALGSVAGGGGSGGAPPVQSSTGGQLNGSGGQLNGSGGQLNGSGGQLNGSGGQLNGSGGQGGGTSACTEDSDACPAGQYCGEGHTCVPGCKNDATSSGTNGTGCASGVCGSDHDCQSCIGDAECQAGRVCGDNQCAPACTAAEENGPAGCGTGLTCCSLHCVDVASDSQHCGVCGTACSAGQFCGAAPCPAGADEGLCVACQDTLLSNVCSIAKVAVVIDGSPGNPSVGRALGAAIAAECDPTPTVREVMQSSSDALNATSGQPVSGGDELLVVAGGNFFENVLKYADGHLSPIYPVLDNGTLEFVNRATTAVVASEPYAENDSSDLFVIQFMRDPTSGSLILNAQGFWQRGTEAAALYLEQAILPAPSTFTKSWYVYQWTDQNDDMTPDLNEIELVQSSN